MTDAPPGPGTVLDARFRLEDLLDESDGALFWRATDLVLARNVSVHVLPGDDPRSGALLDAARSSALVSDVRLLRVLDAAAVDGVAFVVNEWGSGVSLDRMIAEGALSPRRAAWVVKEAAEAITVAHRSGVAHGRLLPENVMIAESGSVKLIGFVIDSVLRSPSGPVRSEDGTPLTPAACDVLNLAALLYAALVGRWPGTEGSTIPAAPAEHGRPLRPRRVRAGVPRPLDAICEQVLNSGAHPHAIPIETAAEIAAALADFIGDPGGSTSWGGHQTTAPAWWSGDRPTSRPASDPLAEADSARDNDHLDRDHPDTDQPDTDDLLDTDDLALTGLIAAADRPDAPDAAGAGHVDDPLAHDDPEATRPVAIPATPAGAAMPVRGGVAPPTPTERPLFVDGPPRARSGDDQDTSTGSFLSSLMAAGGTRAPAAGATAQRSTGAGNGPLPSAWGPDLDVPPPGGAHPAERDRPGRMPGSRWLVLGAVLGVLVLIVVVVIVGLNLGRGSADDPGEADRRPSVPASASPSARALTIAGVTDFDPEGSPPEENPDLAELAVDGDPGTAWRTLVYRGNPRLGGLKSGVGLLVDLGRAGAVGEVRLRLVGSPTAVRILAAPGARTAPTGVTGLRTLASDGSAGTTADLRAGTPVTTRWLVVWLTSLPSVSGGYQGQVAEVSVRS